MVLRGRLFAIVWLLVGVVLAANRHYLAHLDTWRLILSAILAILLWPLLLLGISLHVHQ